MYVCLCGRGGSALFPSIHVGPSQASDLEAGSSDLFRFGPSTTVPQCTGSQCATAACSKGDASVRGEGPAPHERRGPARAPHEVCAQGAEEGGGSGGSSSSMQHAAAACGSTQASRLAGGAAVKVNRLSAKYGQRNVLQIGL